MTAALQEVTNNERKSEEYILPNIWSGELPGIFRFRYLLTDWVGREITDKIPVSMLASEFRRHGEIYLVSEMKKRKGYVPGTEVLSGMYGEPIAHIRFAPLTTGKEEVYYDFYSEDNRFAAFFASHLRRLNPEEIRAQINEIHSKQERLEKWLSSISHSPKKSLLGYFSLIRWTNRKSNNH